MVTSQVMYFRWKYAGLNSGKQTWHRPRYKQECIPVGCVPPAEVAVSVGRVLAQGGVSARHPTVNRTIDRCKNITLHNYIVDGNNKYQFCLTYSSDSHCKSIQPEQNIHKNTKMKKVKNIHMTNGISRNWIKEFQESKHDNFDI